MCYLRYHSHAACIEKILWVRYTQHAFKLPVKLHITLQDSSLFLYSTTVSRCSNEPSDCLLNTSQSECSGRSSCHGLKDTPSAGIISILLQCHTYSFISHTIAGMVSSALGRALSPASLSCAPRCGPPPHPLSPGNYTHLKPITTSKGAGTWKWSGVFPLVPCSMRLRCTYSHSQEIINNGKFISLQTNSI